MSLIKTKELTEDTILERLSKSATVTITEAESTVDAEIETKVGTISVSVSFDPAILVKTTDPNVRSFIADQITNRLQQAILQKALND